jgi:predicted ATP-grasp superfamily ATP-dependent carboligase
MKNPVFILSLFDTGLYAARLLRNTGINIYGFDYDSNNPGFYSKYITPFVAPHPGADAKKLLEILIAKRNEFSLKPVLITASEEYLDFIYRCREELEHNFLFLLPTNEILGKIIKRAAQFELAAKCAINVPLYRTVYDIYQLKNAIETINYPVVIKGIEQALWKKTIKEKAVVVKNKDELLNTGQSLLRQNISFIVQQIMSGDCSNNFEYNALMVKGVIIAQNINRKIRQYPVDFGTGCCVVAVENKDIEALGSRFVKENQIEGFSNTEFKYDLNTGNYFFIETNARVWQQIELTSKNNQNYVIKYYNALTDEKIPFITKKSKANLRWVDLPTELLLFLRYRHEINLRFTEFIKSIFSASCLGLWSLKDFRPFLNTVVFRKQK